MRGPCSEERPPAPQRARHQADRCLTSRSSWPTASARLPSKYTAATTTHSAEPKQRPSGCTASPPQAARPDNAQVSTDGHSPATPNAAQTNEGDTVAISLDDIQFLDLMIQHSEAGVAIAQGYLDNSSPAQRQSRIADLARGVVQTQGQAATDMRNWLQQAGIEITAEGDQGDGGDSGDTGMMDGPDGPSGCNCGGMG
ncbi:DUF305 domain-containing protein [Streptomyces sp. NPDC086519]|uniref:DUF305 domain-containing protein n=1 Tax=Streptomyces sp. NPDC086519 TaxID=3154863 RepID=UPI0034433B6C